MKNFFALAVVITATVTHAAASTQTHVPALPCSYDVMASILKPGLSTLQEDAIISPADMYTTALAILKSGATATHTLQAPTLNKTTIGDLNILFYDISSPLSTMLKKINRTHLVLGECALGNILITPSTDISFLKQRQDTIRYLVEHDDVRENISAMLSQFTANEAQLLALWNPNDMLYSKNFADLFYGGNIYKMRSPHAFDAIRKGFDTFEMLSPFIGWGGAKFTEKILKKHMDGFDPKYTWREKYVTPANAVVGGFTLLGWFIAWKTAFSKYRARKYFIEETRKRFTSLRTLGKTLKELGAYARSLEHSDIPSLRAITDFSDNKKGTVASFFKLLDHGSFKSKRNYAFKIIGPVLAAVPRFMALKHQITFVLGALAELDALISIARLVKQHEHLGNHYCYAEYEEKATQPKLQLTQFWHPNFPAEKAIPNDLEVGGDKPRNIIITGPNAGGKSVYTKGLMLNTIFAQSLTVVPAQKAVLTPFKMINTYLNIVEDAGNSVSQHRAEVRRAHDLINDIVSLKEGEFCLTTMDEMFRCTNPAAGSAAAFGIALELGKIKNSILILATHYHKLTELDQMPGSSFRNFHVAAVQNNDGSFTYPYKIYPGINTKVIALDIIKNDRAFDSSVLDYAYEHLKRVESQETAGNYVDDLRKRVHSHPHHTKP